MTQDSFITDVHSELRRIGLDPSRLTGLASQGDPTPWLERLRTLPVGSSWSDVFADTPEGWTPDAPEEEHALGPFDYQEPPFGIAIFAGIDAEHPVPAGEAAINRARALGYPIYGAGIVLDRGAPHLYIVLTLDATEAHANAVADALRDREGIANAYPVRGIGADEDDDD